MPAAQDAHLARIREAWPHVTVLGRHLSQRRRHVDFRYASRRGPYARGMRRREGPHLSEDFPLQLQDLLLGRQDFPLQLFQLRRGVPLRVHQRLLALIIVRNQVRVGFGYLDVVTENVVEPHLERLYARARPLPRLQLGHVLPAVPADVAQFVQLRVTARANGPAVGQVHGRSVRDRGQNPLPHLRDLVEDRGQTEHCRLLPQLRDLIERPSEPQHVPRIGRSDRHLGQQPLEVQNLRQHLAQLAPRDGLASQFLDRLQPSLNLLDPHGRPQQAGAQQPPAHPGQRLIDNPEQAGFLLPAQFRRKNRLEQLQVAHRHRVQDHGLGPVVVGRPVQVVQRRFLRIL